MKLNKFVQTPQSLIIEGKGVGSQEAEHTLGLLC
jgi:hypothetical protein